MKYTADSNRYSDYHFKKCGNSGLDLPKITLGLWHNFGGKKINLESKKMIFRAFDRGVTHFDLANNYGPPPGSAEANFGKIISNELKKYRDEIIISSKAGYDMWPGPYGEWGSKKYITASLDQSLKRMNLDYVDIFYSHRFDPKTPLEETADALHRAVHQGKALYIGISSYSSKQTIKMYKLLKERDITCLIHQPSYSMINRWIEKDLLKTLRKLGMGCIAFSPLAQGMLSEKYINKIPKTSRANEDSSLSPNLITKSYREKIINLKKIADKRNQTISQMALSWVLRHKEVTSALIGARTLKQLDECLDSLNDQNFTAKELKSIDKFAKEQNINLWSASSKN
ncbi:L-glyceraldehyde 3-phosphate reductase [Alphaproteobacteria bacterium]|nr:L-glyceraldehyde 3-phosphate reductase [Alphaproteobacteria bacterium]